MSRMEKGRSRPTFKILTGTGKRPLEKSRLKWENNTRMDLIENGIDIWNFVDLTQDREYWKYFVYSALNIWFP